MAQINKSVTFKNAVIDMVDRTITEYLKDDVKTYKLDDVLADWDQVSGISLALKQSDDLPALNDDGE